MEPALSQFMVPMLTKGLIIHNAICPPPYHRVGALLLPKIVLLQVPSSNGRHRARRTCTSSICLSTSCQHLLKSNLKVGQKLFIVKLVRLHSFPSFFGMWTPRQGATVSIATPASNLAFTNFAFLSNQSF